MYKKEINKIEKEDIINLMGIYLSEWEHRDTLLWSQIFKLFYADLIVIILPYQKIFDLSVLPLDKKIYPIIGIIMSFIFMYIGIGYAYRLTASSDTYRKVMKNLKKRYRRNSIKNKRKYKLGWFFSPPMAFVLVITMFSSLIILSIIMLVVTN